MFTGSAKMLSEQDFRVKSDRALEQARRDLLPLADNEGFEIEFQNGVLDLVFEEPSDAKFVVSPNAPVRQIWVSAMARSYKLAWSDEARVFALHGEPLSQLLDRLTREFLGLETKTRP
jgi:CyaY protein